MAARRQPAAMTKTKKAEPKSAAELRKERQAAALRANLRRRKDQARDRKSVSDAEESPPPAED